ncbi:hypothetical protein Tco_1155256 [Tanacetum coccineum]
MGSLEIRNEEMHTTIPTPPSSPRKILSSDKKINQKLMDIVSILTTTTSKHSHVNKTNFQQILSSSRFASHDVKASSKIDEILHEVVPQIAENATNDLIEYNLKPCIANTIIKDRDAFRSEVPALVSQEFNAYALVIIEELFKNRANDIVLLEALRRKFEKSSPSITSYMEDDFHSQHDEHQEADAPPKGEKIVKRKWDLWEEDNVINEDEVIPENETPELIEEFHNIDKRVPTIFDHARIKATLRDNLSNQYRNTE